MWLCLLVQGEGPQMAQCLKLERGKSPGLKTVDQGRTQAQAQVQVKGQGSGLGPRQEQGQGQEQWVSNGLILRWRRARLVQMNLLSRRHRWIEWRWRHQLRGMRYRDRVNGDRKQVQEGEIWKRGGL